MTIPLRMRIRKRGTCTIERIETGWASRKKATDGGTSPFAAPARGISRTIHYIGWRWRRSLLIDPCFPPPENWSCRRVFPCQTASDCTPPPVQVRHVNDAPRFLTTRHGRAGYALRVGFGRPRGGVHRFAAAEKGGREIVRDAHAAQSARRSACLDRSPSSKSGVTPGSNILASRSGRSG